METKLEVAYSNFCRESETHLLQLPNKDSNDVKPEVDESGYDAMHIKQEVIDIKEESLDMSTRKESLKQNPLACTLCEYEATCRRTLIDHMDIHSEAKPYSCSVCEYKAAYKSSLVCHMQMHSKEMHPCPICEFRTPCKIIFSSHMKKKHGQKDCRDGEKYSCADCKYKTMYKTNLIYHVRKHNAERHQQKLYSCSTCEYKSAYKCNLRSHLKTAKTHSEEKPFSGSIWDCKAVHRSSLYFHMQAHNGGKLYRVLFVGMKRYEKTI